MADINDHGEFATYNLVKERWEGLNILQEILIGYSIDLQNNGGYEIFLKDKAKFSEYTISNIGRINDLLLPIFKDKVFSIVKNEFGYRNIQKQLIFNKFESQLDIGKNDVGLNKCHSKKEYSNSFWQASR